MLKTLYLIIFCVVRFVQQTAIQKMYVTITSNSEKQAIYFWALVSFSVLLGVEEFSLATTREQAYVRPQRANQRSLILQEVVYLRRHFYWFSCLV